MTHLRDPENVAIASLVRIVTDPAAARAALQDFLLQRAGINVRLAEIETIEHQLAERERQVTAREANVRRRETALQPRSE
jgi:hypothetical protein